MWQPSFRSRLSSKRDKDLKTLNTSIKIYQSCNIICHGLYVGGPTTSEHHLEHSECSFNSPRSTKCLLESSKMLSKLQGILVLTWDRTRRSITEDTLRQTLWSEKPMNVFFSPIILSKARITWMSICIGFIGYSLASTTYSKPTLPSNHAPLRRRIGVVSESSSRNKLTLTGQSHSDDASQGMGNAITSSSGNAWIQTSI